MRWLAGLLTLAWSVCASAQPPSAVPHVGGYIPNSQLLAWCKSDKPGDFPICWAFIQGVANAAGDPTLKWPAGPIAIGPQDPPKEQIETVITYLDPLGGEQMSSPASDSVYRALVAKYPFKQVGGN